MICPSCNAEISDNLTFCENCGARLVAEEPPASKSAVPAEVVAPLEQSMGAPEDAGQPAFADAAQPAPESVGVSNAAAASSSPYAQATSPTYSTPVPQDDNVSSTPFVLAIIALVTAILGLFPVSIVLAIIALVMNSGQKKRGEFSTKQSPTTVMSIISLVISVLMFILTVILGSALLAVVASGNVGATGKDNGGITLSVPNSKPESMSSSSASATAASAFAGTWEIESMTYEGENYTKQDLSFLRDAGMDVKLVLASDGKAKLSIFGVSQEGTWRETGPESAEVTLLGATQKVTMSTGSLVLENGSDKLTFIPAAS